MSPPGRAAGASARHVLTLLTGTGAAQVIALVATPALSRLYTPQEFGVFALYASVVALLAVPATGRYELAIVLPETDDDARQLLLLALLIALLVSAVTLVAVALFGDVLAQRSGHAAMAGWLYLLPLSVLLTAVVNAVTCWANRRKQYLQLATSRVAQAVATAGSSVGLGALGWTSAGLLLGSTLGFGVSATLLVAQASDVLRPPLRVDRPRLRSLAQRYSAFPRVNLPHALLDALQAMALLALIGVAFGSHVLGVYAFALRIARTPLALLGASVGQVFQQRAAQVYNKGGDLSALAWRTTLRLLGFAAPFAAAMLVAPTLFGWVFGPAWREAGVYAQILAPWMLLNLLTSPLSQLPLVVGQQGRALAFGVTYQAAMLLPYVMAWSLGWDIRTAMAWQSAAASLVLLAYGAWLHRLAATKRLP